ncbi:hypothetical protein V6N11_009700 [Hibiscus sabdariffa]|uniref:Uncharacterized protein n=1 Tax=Hibiscus sabdariffa TaxID=183260 RepID=A0ABR2P637_9ROSI
MIHHASPLARVLHVNGLVKDQKRLKAIFNSDRGTSPPRGGLVWAETGLSCSGRWGKLAWFPCLACGVHLATSRWPDTMSASPDCDIVGRWGESLDDFSEDEENIVPITEDDDVHLLDVDDVEAVMAGASEENGLDVEDDVWNAAVVRLGSGYTQPVWGYIGPHTEQSVPSYTAYEPPTSMYDVDYTAMRDREHEARVFGSSSSSNYGELVC